MSAAERMDLVSQAWERNRADLVRYARRLLINAEAADDVVQQTAVRALQSDSHPTGSEDLRRWLFRITSNLAIDELRRRGTWSETALFDSRSEAENDPEFVEASLALRGTQEVAAIAREHLAFCFSCVLRSLPPQRAAALLLAEMYGFTVREAASILEATENQIKNWIQEARAALQARHMDRCALLRKNGVCYQCSELSEFFNGVGVDPLAGSNGSLEARMRIVRESHSDLGEWHRRLLEIIEERSAGRR
jgi:RNA polymerase sigma-70 factor (ECF subfamily)